jgi:hypothetical protein
MFTYCLVTKGRREYLPSILNSLEDALKSSDVQVIVMDNGCPEDVSETLSDWCATIGDRKHYVRFDVNDPSAPRVWNMLSNFEVEWISFPGDDDVIHHEFLEDARTLIKQNKGLTAIASSMRIIDSNGNPTGQVREPLEYFGDRVEYLASSLHEPPFLFPSLFIDFSKITIPLPNSRYVFDWWLSLNLIALGSIVSTSKISIDYRVHEDQESVLAPKRRKYLEAQVILSRFIQDEIFQNFLSQLSEVDKFKFWKLLDARGPIYGDIEYGRALMLSLTILIADSMSEATDSANLLGMFAAANGAFLRSGESNAFLSSKYSDVSTPGSNFRLTTVDGTCAELTQLTIKMNFVGNESSSFSIGCQHSASSAQYRVDCDLLQRSPEGLLDSLIVQITETLESSGVLDFKITPVERRILSLLRSLKKFFPVHFISILRKGISK